jgi:hypothetical protein
MMGEHHDTGQYRTDQENSDPLREIDVGYPTVLPKKLTTDPRNVVGTGHHDMLSSREWGPHSNLRGQ